jgi:DNA-binding response OmpR family regulator
LDTQGKVLLAIHDPIRSGRVAAACAASGLRPSLAFDATQVQDFVDGEHVDLIIFDLGLAADLPAANQAGYLTLLSRIVEAPGVPVLALAGGEGLDARILAAGAQAVLPATTTPGDVATAACALVGRTHDRGHDGVLGWGPLELDMSRRAARWWGERISLTRLQYRMLACLVRAEGALVTRAELHRALYGAAQVDDGERIMAHVRRIRDKIEDDSAHPRFLLTVRGEGFRLADDPGPALPRD